MNVIDTLVRPAARSALHRLTVFERGREASLSLAAFEFAAGRLAAELQKAGFARGERIGILAKNGLGWLLLDLAALKAGIVTAGFEYGKFDSVRVLADKYALKGIYTDIAIDAPSLVDVRALVDAAIAEALAQPADAAPFTGYTPADYRTRDGIHDVTTLKFTSGSTGEPKGLGATAGSIDSSLQAVQAVFGHRDGDNLLVFLPLSLLQQRYWVYSALVFSHDVTVATYELAIQAARQTQPTVVMGVPGFYESVRKQASGGTDGQTPAERRSALERLLGARVRYLWTGSAPAAPDTLAYFDDAGMPAYEGYGMNETCIVSKNGPGHHKRGSVGRVLPGKRVRFDANGVLHVASDHPVNLRYAYCAPGDNERIFGTAGEVCTGDLGYLDDDGYLYITGRADDVVVLANGKNVSTRKLEEHIRQPDDIDGCVVVGSGRPYLVAVISPATAGAQPDTAHIAALNRTLPRDEQIVKFFIAPRPFAADGLLTSQFKAKRKEIQRVFQQEIDQLYGATA